ncbi:MAG: type II toxin-antitoxin system death-on-curing family toxin [Clostridia bacterium]|nr:type II toxin-antitoxin system death-on-curing family toxin [Clostridia bacterium]
MIKLDKEKTLYLHELMATETGGDVGVRDYALLDSALNSAFQTFGGQELYPTLQEKGARIGFSLIANHAFVDGNKRIGLFVMLVFLEINGLKITATDEDIIDVGLSVADGKTDYETLVKWVYKHT